MSEQNKTGVAPLLKSKIHCVCTAKLKRGELPVCENEEDETKEDAVSDPTGEVLQAILSKNAATK